NENVDAALESCLRLVPEDRAGLVDRSLSPGFNSNAERADGARNENVATCGLTSYPRALDINLSRFSFQRVRHQLCPISAECVRLDDVDADFDVVEVDFAHQLL